MASKGVLDRQRSGTAVAAVGTAQAAVIGKQLGATLAPFLAKGEKLPDFALVSNLVARWLGSVTGALVDADTAHEAELGDDDAPRKARDAAADALVARLVEVRQQVVGVFGAQVAGALGLKGETPRDALPLSRFSKAVEGKLRAAAQPRSKIKGAHLSLAELADELEALRGPLDAALADVTRESREAQVTLAAKNAAQAMYDAGFEAAATLLEGMLLAAGQLELAGKVKPSRRHAGETAAATGEGDGGSAGTPGSPPAGPSTGS